MSLKKQMYLSKNVNRFKEKHWLIDKVGMKYEYH